MTLQDQHFRAPREAGELRSGMDTATVDDPARGLARIKADAALQQFVTQFSQRTARIEMCFARENSPRAKRFSSAGSSDAGSTMMRRRHAREAI